MAIRLLIPLAVLLAACSTAPSGERSRDPEPSTETTAESVAHAPDTELEARALLEEARAARAAGDHAGARTSVEQAIALLAAAERSPAAGDLLSELGTLAQGVGSLPAARQAFERALAQREEALPEDHPDLLAARARLAGVLYALGDYAGAREIYERVFAARARTLPEDHPDLLAVRMDLASALYSLGDLQGARELYERVCAGYERTLPEDHRDLLRARMNLAFALAELGDLHTAQALQESALAGFERTLPADDSLILHARGALAATLRATGDLARSRALLESVVAARARTLSADHPDLLRARMSLGCTLHELEDFAGARAEFEHVLAGFERTLPADQTSLALIRLNLANALSGLGELHGSLRLQEESLASLERHAPDHPHLLVARMNLGATVYDLGDLQRARELQESVVDGLERLVPEDHPDLLMARMNLATTLRGTGDLAGARASYERALEGLERTLPDEHPDVQKTRMGLGVALFALGEHDAARELFEGALEVFERTLPDDHPQVLETRMNVATALLFAGDYAGARAAYERVLAAYERTLDEDHPSVLLTRKALGNALYAMGELEAAREIHERVLAARERVLPADHPELLTSRLILANVRVSAGDLPGAQALLPGLVSGMLARAASALLLAPRQSREVFLVDADYLRTILFLADPADAPARERIFDLVETRRLVASAAPRAASAVSGDARLAQLQREVTAARARLNDLVAGLERGGAVHAELERLSSRRDEAERAIRRELAALGLAATPIEAGSVAAALPAESAAVGYLRYARPSFDGATGLVGIGPDHVLAHVLAEDGTLARVELGPARELEALVETWRDALGSPLAGRGPGVVAEGRSEEAELGAGRALRRRLLDPILAAAGDDVTVLVLCPDDFVYLVPLDALPLDALPPLDSAVDGEQRRVGDCVRILVQTSFAALLAPPSAPRGEPSLLALGNPSYDAEGSASPALALPPTMLALASAPVESSLRSGIALFQPLPDTAAEVARIAELFEQAFAGEPALLVHGEATKAALALRTSGARFVHLATHGWFAPDSVRSVLDEPAAERGGWQRMSLEERVTGFAPMTLCGLALAGANLGRDALGHVPGILTAEELCSLDLASCELAVLSACETNVGIRRAGQGIQSLQAALHAAGAHTAITSLWKVDDRATRELMQRFYAYLWIEKLSAAEALWKAKSDLRERGHPVRDWAAWVLSGGAD